MVGRSNLSVTLVQLLFLAFALSKFLSVLFDICIVSIFCDGYYGVEYKYIKCLLSCSIFLFLVSFTLWWFNPT